MSFSRDLARLRSGVLLASTVSATALCAMALVLPQGAALAQDGQEDTNPAGGAAGGSQRNATIVVTGSRIRTDGMAAPVPVTVVAADEIEALSPGALISGVSQLPQFYGNQTPNSGNFFVRSGYGSLNLRGLGVNRTLTLLNGRRVPSTSAFGGVDINLFPEAMIQSVETSTGGASAAYGSDAVAGVVNFTLDTNFTGLELSAQGGLTDRGDGENYELSAAWGTQFAGGRGHFLVSGEYYDQEGIFNYQDRDWYQSVGTFGSGTQADPYRFVANTVSANASFDGRIFAPGTAIHQQVFDRAGNVSAYQPGTVSQFPFGIPPARTAGGPNDDLGAEVNSLYPDLQRYSVFTYADFEVSDNLTVFGQYLHGRTSINQPNTPRSSFGGTPTALTIFQDNAFLPADLRQTMVDEGIDSFTLRRMGSIEDIGLAFLDDETTQHIGTVGLTYETNSNWVIDGFYQYGNSKRVWQQGGLRVDRIFAAIDAVDEGEFNTGTPNGNIVCRTSLFGDGFPGCQPLNLFGRGNATAGAVDYVTSFEAGQSITTPIAFAEDGFDSGRTYSYTSGNAKTNVTTFEQHFAEVSAAGDLVDLWAGPLAVAFGGSYRKDDILQLVRDVTNPSSDHVDGHPVLCNDEAPGLRGVNPADCGNTVGVQYSKVSNIKGNAEVWEAFGEVLLPLYQSDGFSAFASGAVRWADYSGSGSIWAYKGGLELEFGEGIRLRGTYSRDVRAGNLSERFDKTGGSAVIDDPRTPDVVEALNVTRFSGGNPLVNPEEADTFTIGAVIQPSFIDGLSLSLDYYDITIDGAISQVGNQSVLDRCFLENAQEFCNLITLDPTTDDIILVGDVFVNVAQAAVRGIDFETSYNAPVSFLGGDESISARVFASWLLERSETNSSGVTTDFAGQTGAAQGSGAYFPYADFKATGGLTYRNEGFSTLLQVRHIGQGIQDVTQTQGVTIQDNSVSAVTYIDLRLGYEFDLAGSEAEIFANVTNLGDESPPQTPSYSAFLGYATQHNASVYDVLGRRYTVGLRLRM